VAERHDRGEGAEAVLLGAARILFGARAERVLAEGRWRRELKRAYRRRVLETHPDRARALGRREEELVREFRAVAEAYALLLEAAAPAAPAADRPAARPAARPPTRPASKAPPRARGAERGDRAEGPGAGDRRPPSPRAPRGERAERAGRTGRTERPATAGPGRGRETDRRPRGPGLVPERRVRLGEYLYYSRRIPFEALIEAIAWQRAQRPRVGRIAIDCGFLSAEDVRAVIDRRLREGALDVPFAEYATRIGLLTPFARLAVLGHQAKLQRRIGRFFVERGWLTEEGLAEARAELLRHNVAYPR
jgi:hypothetical protein